MKILSKTEELGRVIELTGPEWREFLTLIAAVEGKQGDEFNFNFRTRYEQTDPIRDIDFSGVFGAILAFYEAKFKSNELRALVNRFDAYLGKAGAP
jgi:hypothetical protein